MRELKITLPDVPVKEQIKMLENWVDIMMGMEVLTGESAEKAVMEIKKQIKELKN